MANPLVMSAPSPYNIASPLGTPQARRRFSDGSMTNDSYTNRPYSMKTNEVALIKIQSQQDEFMCIVGCILGTVFFLASFITIILLSSPEPVQTERPTSSESAETESKTETSDGTETGESTQTKSKTETSDSTETGESTQTKSKTGTLSTSTPLATTNASDVTDTPRYSKSTYTTDTPKVPTRSPLGQRGLFICTVSVNFKESTLLPADGLCDIIFYESFYVKNKPLEWNDTGLDHFFELARSMQHTSIGASYSPESGELSADVNHGLLHDGLDKLLAMGVKHFGMLDLVGHSDFDSTRLSEGLIVLRDIAEYARTRYPDGYIVLGLHFLSDYTFLPLNFFKTLRLTHFIAVTHLTYPLSYYSSGWVQPMSMMTHPANRSYLFLLSIVRNLDCLRYLKKHANVFLYISFSMRGHYFTVNDASRKDTAGPEGGAQYCLFQPIEKPDDYAYQGDLPPKQRAVDNVTTNGTEETVKEFPRLFQGTGCASREYKIQLHKDAVPVAQPARRVPLSLREPPRTELDRMEKEGIIQKVSSPKDWVCAEEYGKYYSYNTTVGAEYTFDPQENRVLVFDSERGVKEKVCAALVNNSSLMLSLAAYDIDYDQDFEACPNLFIGRGAFRRVKALHFLKGYTPEIHDRVDPVEECIAKTYINVGNPCCPGL
ncbi:uncharacterized protein LOC142772320 [Rhipicephalus microplus]|uniref:uncharacterized protein LOC142772320 n=1 Tax=Rhipicephalus microplus TaxID=6941 RepID=UPI003F6AD10B